MCSEVCFAPGSWVCVFGYAWMEAPQLCGGLFWVGPLLIGILSAWQPFRSTFDVDANGPCLLLSSMSCKG
jgi:hypothetical protein